MSNRFRRPSPATVISLVALFIALGGSAYAVKNNSVRSSDIVNGAVKGEDIRKATIKSKQVNEGSLTFPCRPGMSKLAGMCFDTVPAAARTTWANAVAACDAKGAFLPTPSQLSTAASELANIGTDNDAEWTDSPYEENGNRKATTVAGAGAITYRQQDQLRKYRCAMPVGL
jgi:hypothetical protein